MPEPTTSPVPSVKIVLSTNEKVPLGTSPWLLDRLTHHCDIVETGNESWRFETLA